MDPSYKVSIGVRKYQGDLDHGIGYLRALQRLALLISGDGIQCDIILVINLQMRASKKSQHQTNLTQNLQDGPCCLKIQNTKCYIHCFIISCLGSKLFRPPKLYTHTYSDCDDIMTYSGGHNAYESYQC